MRALLVCLVLLVAAYGCASRYTWETETDQFWHEVTNEYFSAAISLIEADGGYQGFRLVMTNKASHEIEIDWNATQFMRNRTAHGGFMFEGIGYEDRNNPKPPDMLSPGATLRKSLYPAGLVKYSGTWRHELLPDGANGISLVVKAGQKEIRQERTFKMRSVVVKKPSRSDLVK